MDRLCGSGEQDSKFWVRQASEACGAGIRAAEGVDVNPGKSGIPPQHSLPGVSAGAAADALEGECM